MLLLLLLLMLLLILLSMMMVVVVVAALMLIMFLLHSCLMPGPHVACPSWPRPRSPSEIKPISTVGCGKWFVVTGRARPSLLQSLSILVRRHSNCMLTLLYCGTCL